MMPILYKISEVLSMSFGMAWKVGWSLVLGFLISAVLQTLAPRQRILRHLSGDGLKPVAIATGLGIASSSCSYAAASISRTLFRKGAGLVPSLAFLFSSTNLVVELGIVLYLLLGWQFLLGEWIGGIVLIAIMSLLIKLTYPKALVEEARQRGGPAGHDHAGADTDEPLRQKLRDPKTWMTIAQHFADDCRMLWKDIVLGFLIAGALAAVVPAGLWQKFFVTGAAPWIQLPANALLGPIVAALSFVCSIGNVPMAAVLWGAGVSFGGVLAFLYADLIVLPLLDVYRRYYGWKMMAYIAAIFYATMALSGMAMDVAFHWLGLVPQHSSVTAMPMDRVRLDYTLWLNLVALGIVVALFMAARRGARLVASCCEPETQEAQKVSVSAITSE